MCRRLRSTVLVLELDVRWASVLGGSVCACRSMGWYSRHRWPHFHGAIRKEVGAAILVGGW